MKLLKAKEISAELMNCGKGRVWINPKNTKEIKESITKEDIRGLITQQIIKKRQDNFQSTAKANELREKKKQGRRKGQGKRKGTKKTRVNARKQWQSKVRTLRKKLKELKVSDAEKVVQAGYKKVYKMVKGNYFKGKNDLQRYIDAVKLK